MGLCASAAKMPKKIIKSSCQAIPVQRQQRGHVQAGRKQAGGARQNQRTNTLRRGRQNLLADFADQRRLSAFTGGRAMRNSRIAPSCSMISSMGVEIRQAKCRRLWQLPPRLFV